MIDWFVAALRHHAELAFFLTLGIGYLLGKLHFGGFSLGAVTGTLLGRRAGRSTWSHCLPRRQTVLLRAVSVFHRLPLRSAIFPGPAQGRVGAGRRLSDRRDDRPGRRLLRGPCLQLRPRNRWWRDRWITHGVSDNRHHRRRHIPSGDWRRRADSDGQQYSGCVCGDLSDRRRRCCVVPGADRASPDGRRPRQGVRRVRGADGWRQSQASGNRLGLSRHRAAGLPCARGQRCHWQARQGHSSRRALLRRACTPRRPDHRSRSLLPSCRPATSPPSLAAARFWCSRSKCGCPKSRTWNCSMFRPSGWMCSSPTPTWMARRCKNFLTHHSPVAFSCAAYCATGWS